MTSYLVADLVADLEAPNIVAQQPKNNKNWEYIWNQDKIEIGQTICYYLLSVKNAYSIIKRPIT